MVCCSWVPSSRRHQEESGVHPDQHPALRGFGQFQVVGADQPAPGDVDEPVAQDVGAEQHLTVPAFELPQVHPRGAQHDLVAVPVGDHPGGQEHPTAAQVGDQPGDQWVVRAG